MHSVTQCRRFYPTTSSSSTASGTASDSWRQHQLEQQKQAASAPPSPAPAPASIFAFFYFGTDYPSRRCCCCCCCYRGVVEVHERTVIMLSRERVPLVNSGTTHPDTQRARAYRSTGTPAVRRRPAGTIQHRSSASYSSYTSRLCSQRLSCCVYSKQRRRCVRGMEDARSL